MYERSRRARERIGDVVGAATIANNIAEILSDQGLLDDAKSLLRQVDETCRAAGCAPDDRRRRRQPRPAAARAGRYGDAETLLTGALEAFTEIEAEGFVVEMRARLAEVAVLAGDHEQALRAAQEAGSRGSPLRPSLNALLRRIAWLRPLPGRPGRRGAAGDRAEPRGGPER